MLAYTCPFRFLRNRLLAHPRWNVLARWFVIGISGNRNGWPRERHLAPARKRLASDEYR